MTTQRQRILEFIKKHQIGVIATTDGVKPEAAVVEYGETDDLELIIDAFISSRKCKNIFQNPKVAFVIGWDDNITIQYDGEATELKGVELAKYKVVYFKKNPQAKKWEHREGITYFKIVPKWIRYSDLNKSPWEVFEISL